MARLTITIASDNDALVDPENSDLEIESILRRLLTSKIYQEISPWSTEHAEGNVLDSNGNTVGSWSYIPGDTEGDNQDDLDASVAAHEIALGERDDLG